MARPRRLAQPGPAEPVRIESFAGRGRTLEFALEPGQSLNDAVARPLLEAGTEGAALTLDGGSFHPFTYLMPALAPDDEHAAWYSAPVSPGGEARIETANVTFGRREGLPFIHCHGLWIEADGRRRGGHPLPHETFIATPPRARVWGLTDVGIRADPDPETAFTLFHPVALDRREVPATGARMIAARVRPNEDLTESIEALCRRHGFAEAAVRGGLGSLIGARFEDGRTVESIATEVLVLEGRVAPDAQGEPRARLEIALVDADGAIHQGRLVRGRNPVCITFELVLEELTAVRGDAQTP